MRKTNLWPDIQPFWLPHIPLDVRLPYSVSGQKSERPTRDPARYRRRKKTGLSGNSPHLKVDILPLHHEEAACVQVADLGVVVVGRVKVGHQGSNILQKWGPEGHSSSVGCSFKFWRKKKKKTFLSTTCSRKNEKEWAFWAAGDSTYCHIGSYDEIFSS